MKELFASCPPALRWEIWVRIGLGIAALPVFLAIWTFSRSLALALPMLAISVFLTLNGLMILAGFQYGTVITAVGRCTGVERYKLRHTAKSIRLDVDGKAVEIHLRNRLHRIQTGDTVTVYLPENAPVYERQGVNIIYSYYAISLEKEA